MKYSGILIKASIVIAVIFLALSIFLIVSNAQLKKEISEVQDNSRKIEQNFKTLKTSYERIKKESEALKELNDILKKESSSLSAEMKETEIELQKTLDRLSDFQSTVQKSIQWFKANVNIENLSKYEQVRKDLAKCIKTKNECEIDLNCINEVNKKNNFRYRYDEDTTGKADFLKDLELIYKQNGGDCEDFSLLFRAEYNYLLDKCLINYTRGKIHSVTEDTKIDGNYMYIICGTFDTWLGHCVVALTRDPVKSSADIYKNIKDSVMVEPQNGEFVGYMNDTKLIKIFDDGMPPDTLYYLDFVITDDDLNIFYPYGETVAWVGYHDFLEISKSLKEDIEK